MSKRLDGTFGIFRLGVFIGLYQLIVTSLALGVAMIIVVVIIIMCFVGFWYFLRNLWRNLSRRSENELI